MRYLYVCMSFIVAIKFTVLTNDTDTLRHILAQQYVQGIAREESTMHPLALSGVDSMYTQKPTGGHCHRAHLNYLSFDTAPR
ncbi:hypothetical protein VCRA2114E365_150097 [Vibrio crassostreae]|nr:hypothetical protein VCRA2115O371_130023 [Vibrio crassostreae]CAK1761581.1 hypothetical protein VCRA2114O369_140023 [Vibrio crassostreae]CAK1762790.1 hypothetical protein VCRA2113O362_140024 [Vibrio crassostreae]CAK1762908.1 hypothetical protein VCRA2113O199_140023 [Vibrio crassostreae]CAK1769484.1 hypothetical protein VCRA2117O376_140096 [Vibrio crassostreae]